MRNICAALEVFLALKFAEQAFDVRIVAFCVGKVRNERLGIDQGDCVEQGYPDTVGSFDTGSHERSSKNARRNHGTNKNRR